MTPLQGNTCALCKAPLRWDWRRCMWVANGRALCTGGLPGAYHAPQA